MFDLVPMATTSLPFSSSSGSVSSWPAGWVWAAEKRSSLPSPLRRLRKRGRERGKERRRVMRK